MGYTILWTIFVIALLSQEIVGDGSNPFGRIGESLPIPSGDASVELNKSAEISANKVVQLDADGDNGGGSVFGNAFDRLTDMFSLGGKAGVNADFNSGADDGQVVKFGSSNDNDNDDSSISNSTTSTTPAPALSDSSDSTTILATPTPTPTPYTTTPWPTTPRPRWPYPYPSEHRPVSPKFPNSDTYNENNNAIDNPHDC